ncbi:MAG: hypothetical protein B0D92_06400 [Spirochaeta sp. LUC14_002_19_P3]|nr:MAG: hypothetical protein B0D92_06400 [Spirochaeta sp. LUC14_002_19_P3]
MLNRLPHILLFLCAGLCFGAEDIPWVLLEQGKAAYEARDIARSMELVLKALELTEEYPEAEYWLGRLYAVQGQDVLAEEHYRRALRLALFLRVPEDEFLISYSLAQLLLDTNRREEAEIILMELANMEGASSRNEINFEHRGLDVLTTAGIDELVYLYRSELHQSLQARRMLGLIAWEDGRYRSSLLHSARTVLSLLSTASRHYREFNSEWRFDIDLIEDPKHPDRDDRYPGPTDGTADLLFLVQAYIPGLMDWMLSEGFWQQFYLLSVSLYAEGYSEIAQSLWRLMAPDGRAREEAGLWGNLAVHQLKEPFITSGSLEP